MSSQISAKSKPIRKQGRPSLPIQIQICPEVHQHWFGHELSIQMMIFLTNAGSLQVRYETGKGAARRRQRQKLVFSEREVDQIKKFGKQFKAQMKDKIKKLLAQMNYDAQLCLLLKNNQIEQLTSDQPLDLLVKFIDPRFVATYKRLVQYHQHEFNEGSIDDIFNILLQDRETHKMLFDLQIIKTIIEEDREELNKAINDPEYGRQLAASKFRVLPITIENDNTKQYIQTIEKESFWIRKFIFDFFEILNKFN